MTYKGTSSVQTVEVIPTPIALYAVCVGCSEESHLYASRTGLDQGLPRFGWKERYNREAKDSDWYCPDCVQELTLMGDESDRSPA